MSSLQNDPGILPVAILVGGEFTLIKPARVIEELPSGTHCAGIKTGTLRFLGQDDPHGHGVDIAFKSYLGAFAEAAAVDRPLVNLTGRIVTDSETSRASLLTRAGPCPPVGASLPVVYLTMGVEDGIKRREMIAYPQVEPDKTYADTLRIRDLTNGSVRRISLTPAAFARALKVAVAEGAPFVNAALQSVMAPQTLIQIALPANLQRSLQRPSA